MRGQVKWFSRKKGYGFIMPDDGGADTMAHYSNIAGSGYRNLYEGQRVEFEIDRTRAKGANALNIRVVPF
ncbi:MAG: cold-shock protein [Anaerolineales bacterium]|nr:cold-shock protein [Anaerolineales bacterium]